MAGKTKKETQGADLGDSKSYKKVNGRTVYVEPSSYWSDDVLRDIFGVDVPEKKATAKKSATKKTGTKKSTTKKK